MKFEKLTENKIRVIISNEDIPKENINNKKFVKFALENQDFLQKFWLWQKKNLILIMKVLSYLLKLFYFLMKF